MEATIQKTTLCRVRKLIGKPALPTIADCESEARRIQSCCSHSQQGHSQPFRFRGAGATYCGRYCFCVSFGEAHGELRAFGFPFREFRSAHFLLSHILVTKSVDGRLVSGINKSTKETDMANNLP